MTNQQGAPEALRPIARYKIGYHTDEWGMRDSTPGGVSDPAGQWVRYDDHIAALASAAAQPNTIAFMQYYETEEGINGWYLHHPQFYCDIEQQGKNSSKWSIFFRHVNGSEAYSETQAQPGADERRLRRILCARYEFLPYMDDGEAQGQKLDWLRCTVDQIEARILEVDHERFLASAAAPAEQPDTTYAELPEPDSYLFQHDETGLTQHVDAQQVEWGFERNNPRLRRVSGTFTEPQMLAFADATHALRASRGQAPAGAVPDEQMPILRWIMKTADAAKEPCGDDPESPSAVRNATLAAIAGAAAQALGLVRGPSYEDTAPSVLEDTARESEYRRGYRHGYEQRDAEVRGALA